MGGLEGLPLQSSSWPPPCSGGKAPARLSCLAWEAVIEKRRSSANHVHQVRSSLNSRETASCIAATARLKPCSTPMLACLLGRACSERRQIPHQLRYRSTSRYTAQCSEEMKLTMIVEVGVQYLCLTRRLMEALGTNLCDSANS